MANYTLTRDMTSTLVGQLVTLQIIFEDCKNETPSEKA